MAECIFCRISQKEASAETILETEHVLSFLDIQPKSLGHTLVIPKRHATRLADLSNELASEVFKATKDVVSMLEKALKPDAFTIGINDGEGARQEVPHLHVNVIPRFRGDGARAIHSVVHNPPREDIKHTAARIRSAT